MKSIIYYAWDGTQLPFTLKRKDVMDAFMENIMKGMTPNMSMAQMMWEGFDMSGMDFRVMGLEDMLKELEQEKQELYEKYNLENAFDDPVKDMKDLLENEAHTRDSMDAEEKSPLYDELPPGLLEKLRSLEDFQFQDESSKQVYDAWQERKKDIEDLFEFYAQYAEKFSGEESLSFEQAVELMRQIQAINNTQQQLMNGDFRQMDPEKLKEMLGDEASRSLAILIQLPQMVSEEGIIRFDKNGLDMTPKGIRNLGELAFGQVFNQMRKDKQGGHIGNAPQTGEIEPDSSRPYQYGDRFDMDITRSILGAVSKGGLKNGIINLSPDDFYVREREKQITTTSVMLLDLSWSMSWEGRFEAAKRVALALDHYIRTRFPKDKLYIIGFSTEARELKGKELALSVWDWGQAYTNLQGALRLAMKVIRKSGNRNNRVTVITDGQPTAYYDGPNLRVELPGGLGVSPNAVKATLAEIRKVTAQGMNIDTFMLDDNPALVEFIRQISKINGGRAVICVPGDLGEIVMLEEIKRNKNRR